MAHTDTFSSRAAMPLFDAGHAVGSRPVRKASGAGSFFRFVLLAIILSGASYGGLQWWRGHHTPWPQSAPVIDERSTANDHLPASLPEIRVKDRDEP